MKNSTSVEDEAASPLTHPERLDEIARSGHGSLKLAVARNGATRPGTLHLLSFFRYHPLARRVRMAVASHPRTERLMLAEMLGRERGRDQGVVTALKSRLLCGNN